MPLPFLPPPDLPLETTPIRDCCEFVLSFLFLVLLAIWVLPETVQNWVWGRE